MELGDEGEEFDIAVEDAMEDQPQKGGRATSGKSKVSGVSLKLYRIPLLMRMADASTCS